MVCFVCDGSLAVSEHAIFFCLRSKTTFLRAYSCDGLLQAVGCSLVSALRTDSAGDRGIKEAKGAKTEAVVELEKGADTVVRTYTPSAA